MRYIKFLTPSSLTIINNKIALIYWEKEPIRVLISSKQLSKSFHDFFYSIWKITRK